jgi:3-dehydroquinate synthase
LRRVTVAVTPPYDIVVGAGAIGALNTIVGDRRRVLVVTQRAVFGACRHKLGGFLDGSDAPNNPVGVVFMDDGEQAKSFATVELLCREFTREGLLRGDAIVALGGGVVGDTAGFAAAVYHRGVAVVQAPTTLLAMVDAAIGGKTAVNLPEGKNLVGSFHQPIAVLADTTMLDSLPETEFRCGLGEVVKYSLLPQGAEVAALLGVRRAEIVARDPDALEQLVAACAAVKAEIVAADPEERTGARAALNYGHTLAHALETTGGHALAHGEAVAIGLVFAVHLARALERVGADVVDRTWAVIDGLGLPTAVPADDVTADSILEVMRRDKKAKGGLTFVLPGPLGMESVDDPPIAAIDTALRAVGVTG